LALALWLCVWCCSYGEAQTSENAWKQRATDLEMIFKEQLAIARSLNESLERREADYRTLRESYEKQKHYSERLRQRVSLLRQHSTDLEKELKRIENLSKGLQTSLEGASARLEVLHHEIRKLERQNRILRRVSIGTGGSTAILIIILIIIL
jgi:predicted RNase H-like nuclease (RuvC/YqgF family)